MDKIIYEKVGFRLKQARELRHITLEEAGKKVDAHKSTVLRWENGETEKIKLPIIEALASYYDVNPEWLMGYDVPMERDTPYSAIYDFANESDKKLLNNAIVYAIQNKLNEKEIQDNDYIRDCINNLSQTDKKQMMQFITNIAIKFKGKDDFNLKEYIQSLRYNNAEDDNYTPEIRAIARGVAKLNPEKKELFKNLLKQMSDEADEADKK